MQHRVRRSAYRSLFRGPRDIVRKALAWSATTALLLIGSAAHAQDRSTLTADDLVGNWQVVTVGNLPPRIFKVYGVDQATDGSYVLNAGYGADQSFTPVRATVTRSPEGWKLTFVAPWGSTLAATQAGDGSFRGAFHGKERSRGATFTKIPDVPAADSVPDTGERETTDEEGEDLDPKVARQSQALLSAPLPTNLSHEKLAALHVSRAEAARRLGNLRVQIAELRQAYVLTQGRNYRVVFALASATHLAGDWEDALRLREEVLGKALTPLQRFLNALTLALYYGQVGQTKRAETLVAEVEPLLAQMGSPTGEGAWAHGHHQWTRGALLFYQGRFADAEGALRIATQRNVDAQRWKGATFNSAYRARLGQVDGLLSQSLSSQGKLAEAEWILRDAIARSIQESGRDSVPTGMLVIRLAGVQLRQGRFAAATKAAESAVATLERRDVARSSNWLLSSLLHAGWGHALSGDYVPAISAFERRNANLAADPKAIRGREGGSVVWGYALIRMGRAEEALPMLKAHYEAARAKAEKGYAALERAGMYAYALHRAGRSDDAAKLFAESVAPLLEARRKARAADRLDALLESIANWIVEGYLEFLSAKASAGDAQAIGVMFRFADVARGSSVQRAVAQAASRATIREPALAELARREQDLANRAVALTRIAEDLAARPSDRQPKQVIAGMRRDIQSMEVERDAVKKEIAARFPEYAQLIEPRPVTLAQVQKLLRPGEVMVSLYTSHDRTYVWAIPQAGPVRFAQSTLGTAAIARSVDALRSALDVGDVLLERFPAYDVRLAHSLYEKLLQPVEEAWKGAQTLIVVPHGSLGRLPFAALPVASSGGAVHGAGFAGYRDVEWLLKRIAIIQLPSVSALPSLREMQKSAAAPSAFVGVGNPAFLAEGDSAPSGGSRGVRLRNLSVRASGDPAKPFATAEFKRLPPLPDTAQEVREIAAILSATDQDMLLGVQASETNVKGRKLDAYRVVMFATHGLVPGDFDGLTQPALALANPDVTGEKDSDGLLTLEEVLGLKLNADWVVLSACNTASPDGAGSEAVSGLGRAFFYAGARSLLVSNWPVETVSARLLTTELFRRQAQDPALTRAEALRASMLSLMQTGGAKDGAGKLQYTYAHPMFWAPFTLIGDGSR